METCLLPEKNITSPWDEAINCASYIQNRVPHKSVIGATPFEALLGHKPDVSHLRVFGSKAWSIIPMDKRKAFQAQSSEWILLGYVEDEKEYKFMELPTRKCFIEHSVQFEEDQLLDPPQFEEKRGIKTLSFPFDDDTLSHVSDSDDEEQDQHDLDIEVVPH